MQQVNEDFLKSLDFEYDPDNLLWKKEVYNDGYEFKWWEVKFKSKIEYEPLVIKRGSADMDCGGDSNPIYIGEILTQEEFLNIIDE